MQTINSSGPLPSPGVRSRRGENYGRQNLERGELINCLFLFLLGVYLWRENKNKQLTHLYINTHKKTNGLDLRRPYFLINCFQVGWPGWPARGNR